jgi:hypothetical protein
MRSSGGRHLLKSLARAGAVFLTLTVFTACVGSELATRRSDGLYLDGGQNVQVTPRDISRLACLDGQVVVCAASSRLEPRSCRCP